MTQPDKPVTQRVTPIDRSTIQDVEPIRASWSIPARYAFSIALTFLAFGATMLVHDYLGRTLFVLFWPVILISAWFAGFGPSLLGAVLAVLLVDYSLIPPDGLSLTQPDDIITLVAFLVLSSLTSWAVNHLSRAQSAAAVAARDNARLVRQLDDQSVELNHQLEEAQAMQEELEISSEELAERTSEAESAEQFARGILESISDPFVVQDSDWRFRYMNSAAENVFKESGHGGAKELIGKVVWDVWPDIKGSGFEKGMRRAAETRTPGSFEEFYPQLGRWAELYCYPLQDGGLAIQWKNTTDKKRAEEAAGYLSKASELLSSSLDYERTLSDVAHLIVPHFADWCGISVLDEHGEPQQLAVAHVDPEKVKYARELNEKYPPDKNATTGVPQVIRTGVPELYAEIPDELLVASAIDEEHLRITRELGLKSAMVVPLSTADKTFGAITVVSAESGRRYTPADMDFLTELARRSALAVENARLHAAEQEARRAAEGANAAKTQFLAVMSHELRTPLNAIGGYAELLLMGIRGGLTPDQQADLERIQRSQRNLLSLINDILNYAKLEAGHVDFAIDKVEIHPLLMDLEPLITPQLRARDLTYDYTGCDPKLTAWGDAEKVRQIILNLLSNAIKFTESGGTIAIACVESGDLARITVRDTGIGIPPDKLASVFEPFVQLERKLTSAHEGTGLGLAISRDLARGMGGELIARSVMGEGSEFELTLRRAEVVSPKENAATFA
jgi:signal transduction histidine kinase